MLKPVKARDLPGKGFSFAIVASEYNAKFVNSMVQAARGELDRAGADEVEVIRVPGAFEIPVIAARLARGGDFDAILCLGVVLRGATTHAQHIGESVSQALALLQIQYLVPVIHEVLLLENEEQARERCLDPERNRGREAAQTALSMARTVKNLP